MPTLIELINKNLDIQLHSWRMRTQAADREDIAQTAVLLYLRAITRGNYPPDKLPNLVRLTVRSAARAFVRERVRNRCKLVPDMSRLPFGGEPVDIEPVDADFLAQLPPELLPVAQARREGLSVAAGAKRCKVTPNTYKRQSRRLRASLDAYMEVV